MQESKVCSKCKQFKMSSEFSKRGGRLRSHCKVCDKAYRDNRKLSLMTTEEHISWFKKTIKWILS